LGVWGIYTLEWHGADGSTSSAEEIGEFLQALWPGEVKRKRIPRRLTSKSEIVRHIARVAGREEKILSVYCEDCHQNTYGLCRCIADRRSSRYAYYHFDHHPDDSPGNETIVLGNFVEELLRDTNAADVRFIGNAIPPRLRTKMLDIRDIYLSVDLDFMSSTEVQTRYTAGTWKREELLVELDGILRERNLISADCLGYYGIRDPKSCLLYACVCGRIVGKETSEFEQLHDLAREDRLTYSQMYETLGLQPQ
jgi:hypothetical protein